MKILILLLLIFAVWGCYYENEKNLYGKPNTTCDTTAVTYSTSIKPILQTYCLSCHSNQQISEGAGGGNRLENYADLRILALNGRLFGAIEHAPGFSPMPKFGSKLSDCNISIIRTWIRNGIQNN